MAGVTALASSVGAGVSQVRLQNHIVSTQLKDRKSSEGDVRTVALHLLQSALKVSGTAGRDLDVLA